LTNKTATAAAKSTARLTDSIAISHSEESKTMDKYIKSIRAMNKKTA
jgi:hypothetical protein